MFLEVSCGTATEHTITAASFVVCVVVIITCQTRGTDEEVVMRT